MAMLTNMIQYLVRKNKKFLGRSSGYKGSKKEDKKGCFNLKKTGHFIVDCPDLQKEKSKEKSKKPSFNSNKFRKHIKQSLMATWEDLDNESGSEKDEAEEEGNVALENEALGLVATEVSEATSEVEPTSEGGPPSKTESETDSEDENEICLRGMENLKSWYLDIGCSRHMTGEKSLFLTMKEGGAMGFGGNQNGRIIDT